jgi:hypothetical protein
MTNRFELPPESAESDPSYDGIVSAPASHIVVFEDGTRREMVVILPPNAREPFHHHLLPSEMRVIRSAPLRYFLRDGSSFDISKRDVSPYEPFIEQLEPEPIHSVENLSSTDTYFAIRIEFK